MSARDAVEVGPIGGGQGGQGDVGVDETMIGEGLGDDRQSRDRGARCAHPDRATHGS
ncbi:hypothetical protein [Cryobacterium ruanii]|uniref:hypothetical protein n=1 Tax=Cryobacterium ruanii TaxID=1259197 RepID=UPI00141B45CE|nr:hypothetical protein [Cryobacterium ruanii]